MAREGNRSGAGTAERGPGRKRDEATRQAILQAAFEILRAEGYGGFTMEAVAARSGAAKTTIYRWWPSKGALAVDSFLAVYERETPFPQSESAVADLKAHLCQLARAFGSDTGRVLAGIVAAAQADPPTADLYRGRVVEQRRIEGRRLLRRGIANGELRPDIDIDAALDALYGAFYLRLLIRLGPCDAAWAERLADTVLRGLRAEPGA